MAIAGYKVALNRAGTATAVAGEPLSGTGVSNQYQIDDPARRALDRSVVPTFFAGGTAIPSAQIEKIDYLFGKVTFTSDQGTNVTADITYFPLQAVAGANSFTLNHTADLIDNTDFETGGWRTRQNNFRDVQLSVTRWDSFNLRYVNGLINGSISDTLLIEVIPDRTNASAPTARGYFLIESENRSGDVDSLESAELSFQLDADARAAYSWSDL